MLQKEGCHCIDNQSQLQAWNETRRGTDRFRLTLSDVRYLEPEQRPKLPLASPDNDLRAADTGFGVELLGV